MFGFMLGLPAAFKVALVGLVVVGALQARHWWQVRGLEREIATLTQALNQERTANAQLRVGLADVQANRDTLASRLREQSQAIEILSARARGAEAAAALSATRVLEAGRKLSEALRASSGPARVAPGHAAMNDWIQGQFARKAVAP